MALLVSAALLVCGVAGAAGAGAADAPPLRIRMFGDSVMLGARDDLLAALPGTDTYVDAVESRSLLGTTPVLVAHPDLLGDVVVLDLGYNDAADAGVFRERVEAMMQALAGVPRVVWLTQSVFQPARAAMNDELRAAATRHANLDVVDWDAQVSAHPDYVAPDGLHLTASGQAAFAGAVRDRVDGYRASLRTSSSAPVTATVAGASATRADGRAVTGAERRAEARASSPEEGPMARTFAAVALGLVAMVVLGALVLLRRGRSRGGGGSGQARWQRPVPAHRSHSGAPPLA